MTHEENLVVELFHLPGSQSLDQPITAIVLSLDTTREIHKDLKAFKRQQ